VMLDFKNNWFGCLAHRTNQIGYCKNKFSPIINEAAGKTMHYCIQPENLWSNMFSTQIYHGEAGTGAEKINIRFNK
jgi:hypothetical protein